MSIKTLLLGDSAPALKGVGSLLKSPNIEVVGASLDLKNATDEVESVNPDLVLIICSANDWIYKACQQIYHLHPDVVIVAASNDLQLSVKAANAGADSILEITSDVDAFNTNIEQAYSNEKTRREFLLHSGSTKHAGDIITMFSPKGGVGKTMVGTNLAVELARRNNKVVYLDFDLLFGDANVFLGINPENTLVEYFQEQQTVTIDSIRNYLYLGPSGVQLLSAPTSPEYASHLSPTLIEPLLNTLRKYYDYIIIDTTCDFSELNLFLMEESKKILYIAGLDISLLSSCKRGLVLMDSLNFKEKVEIVVNRVADGGITVDDLSKVMGKKPAAEIPLDFDESVKALNQGVPIVMNSSNEISLGIRQLANLFTSDEEVVEEVPTKKSLFSFGGKKKTKKKKDSKVKKLKSSKQKKEKKPKKAKRMKK